MHSSPSGTKRAFLGTAHATVVLLAGGGCMENPIKRQQQQRAWRCEPERDQGGLINVYTLNIFLLLR